LSKAWLDMGDSGIGPPYGAKAAPVSVGTFPSETPVTIPRRR